MHKSSKNDSSVLHSGPLPEDLRDIRELNLLFLILLQNRALRGAECFGLAAPITRRIQHASHAVLNGMSALPRTVFVLDLECVKSGGTVPEERDDHARRARHALALTAILTAWNMARQRTFLARVFLGLSVRESHYLGTLPMMKLHELAENPALLRCAFPESIGLWTRLLQHAKQGLPPTLQLLGLQPQLIPRAEEQRKSYPSRIA